MPITENKQPNNWWEDGSFVAELDARYEALENGTDKGVTLEQLKANLKLERAKRYGN
jgi:hypothetical protein